ncbi:hypothetical protein G210_4387 [Candida maltosa Xu316]|uniref:Phosphoglycerate mutase n=1 Tax=Candida maltosa (strain Xu316) TaxID=1245528 RepID=M3JT29_CANMX|nr:hypothetical protein G210_4387 [Candida maltosa Xu316]
MQQFFRKKKINTINPPNYTDMSKSIPNSADLKDGQITDQDRKNYKQLLDQYNSERPFHWEFSIVPGIFKQSLEETDDSTFDNIKEHFGIIPTWDEIINQLHTLNAQSDPEKVQYKLFFLARHGQGYHNLKHDADPEAWEAKWKHLFTDGKTTWGPDPELTKLGEEQAKDNNKTWKNELVNNKNQDSTLILPTKFFSSPFRRSINTLVHTWHDIVDLKEIKPLIEEHWRETIGTVTCDQRSKRSVIAEKYEPLGFKIEPGFEELDALWTPDRRETVAEQAIRQNSGFQEIFNDYPKDEIVSITSHAGSIRAQLMVLGHRAFAIGTGGMIAVFVKGVKVRK